MLNRIAVLMAVMCLGIGGCTKNAIFRSDILDHPAAAPRNCDDAVKCGTHSIEVTEDYTMFFVELDEQGRFYDPKQFQAIVNFLSDNKETDMSIVTFVHGWRHNAEYRDRNVQLARDTLIFTALGEAPKPHPNPSGEPRKVVGIYVGWRGLSNSAGANVRDDWSVADAWEVISVWDRKNTAQNVAVGSARELFSMLRAHQERANASVTPQDCDAKKYEQRSIDLYHCKRVRLMIVGHSFGGLLVYNAVAGSLIDSVVSGFFVEPTLKHCRDEFDSPPGRESAMVRSYADLIVLINPAIEGARFEPLHQAVTRRAMQPAGGVGAFCPNQRPVLVSVTSKFDWATGIVFKAVRATSTLFESATPVARENLPIDRQFVTDEEHVATINTLGHVPRFHSHFIETAAARSAPQEVPGKVPDPYAKQLLDYCASPAGTDPVEELLRKCRCGSNNEAWFKGLQNDVLQSKAAKAAGSSDKDKKSCNAYVEELNAAQMMNGTGSPLFANLPWTPSSSRGWNRQRGDGWAQTFCGGATVYHAPAYAGEPAVSKDLKTRHSPGSPVWNVYSEDETVIKGHSDLQKPKFMVMLQQLYHTLTVRQFGTDNFGDLGKHAKDQLAECVTQ